MKKFIFGLLCFAFVGTANAVVIDFSSGSYGSLSYSEDGFSFTVPSGNHLDSGLSDGALNWHELESASTNSVNNVVTLTFAGASFDITSFDIVQDIFSSAPRTGGLDINSSASDFLNVASLSTGLVSLNWSGLTWVTFDLTDNDGDGSIWSNNVFAIDNVIVNGVPEPSILALLSLGLAGIGFSRRKRLR